MRSGAIPLKTIVALRDHKLRWPLFAFALASLGLGLYQLLGQTVFWPTGGVVYMLPLVLALHWMYAVRRLVRDNDPPRSNAAYGFLIGCAVGNSIELILPIVVAYVTVVVPRRWRALSMSTRRAVAWRCAGVVAGALLLAAAPGNYKRAEATPGSFNVDPSYAVPQYAHMLTEIGRATMPLVAITAALAAVSLLVSLRSPAQSRTETPSELSPLTEAFGLAFGALLSIVPVLAVPPQFAMRNGLYMLVFGLIAVLLPLAHWLHNTALRHQVLAGVGIAALTISLLASAQLADDARMASAIRERQVARDRVLHQASATGNLDVSVAPLGLRAPPTLHEVDVGPNPDQWYNRCTAKYYRLHSIKLDPKLAAP